MGAFYTNYTLRGPNQQEVAAALAGRKAVVTPINKGCVVVYDDLSDDQDMDCIAELASRLSSIFHCPVLAVLDHDDDILWYQLYEDGNLTDEYDSTPGYFDPLAEPSLPAGGKAGPLCAAFGSHDVRAVESILRKSSFSDDGYLCAHWRHADLIRALGLSEFAVLHTYRSFERGQYPSGLSAKDIMSSE